MPNKKEFIQLGIFLIIIIAAIIFFVIPIIGQIQEQRATLYSETVALERQRIQNSDIIELTRQYNEIQENSEALKQAFVDSSTSSILLTIEEIETLATSNGLEQSLNINPLPDNDENTLTSSTITLDVDGSYDDLYAFLRALESLPYYLVFNNMAINQMNVGGYSMKLTGLIYWN